jgi:hypothetical protein
MFGNVAEITASETNGVLKIEVLGGSWQEEPDQSKLFANPTSDIGFRVLRKLNKTIKAD